MEVLLENVAALNVSLVTKKHEVVLKDPLHAPVELDKSDTIAQRRTSGFDQREVSVAS